jgi:hypothetical protein
LPAPPLNLQDILTPGNVLSLFCEFTTPPKEKWLLLVSVNPRLLFFIINSELNEYRSRTPHVREAQVELRPTEQEFLAHPSWLDCSKAIRLIDANEIAHQFQQGIGRLVGRITATLRQQVRAVVEQSVTLENRDKKSILADLPL